VDLETFNWLLTDAGQALLAETIASDLSDAAQLRELTRLRRLATPERAAAAFEIARLRRRAAAKFSSAESLYFTREALEQASGEQIASPFSIQPPLSPPSTYLYEPDPAVVRAHVIGQLAERLGAAQIDREIAYLTADRLIETALARCWRVLEWLPWNLKRLRPRLRELDAGVVTVKKRGSPLDTDALARQLSGDGTRAGHRFHARCGSAGGIDLRGANPDRSSI